MNLIELGKKYVTRAGRACEVLKIDAAGPYPVVVLIKLTPDEDYIVRLTKYGRGFASGGEPSNETGNDLLELPKQYAGWVNVFEGSIGAIRCSRLYDGRPSLPLASEPGTRLIARLHVEFTEGQDL